VDQSTKDVAAAEPAASRHRGGGRPAGVARRRGPAGQPRLQELAWF